MERSEEIARTLVAEIRRDPGVDYTYTTVGGTSGAGDQRGQHLRQAEGARHAALLPGDHGGHCASA